MTNRETITRISVFAEDYCRAPPTDAATDPYSKRIGTGTVAMQLCIQKSVFGCDVSLSLSGGHPGHCTEGPGASCMDTCKDQCTMTWGMGGPAQGARRRLVGH